MRRVRTLGHLFDLGNDCRKFVVAFVGRLMPLVLPHGGDWKVAEDHWEIVVMLFAGVKEVARSAEATSTEVLDRAELAARLALWAVAKDNKCPLDDPVTLKFNPILREAK